MPLQKIMLGNFPAPSQWTGPNSTEAKTLAQKGFWSPSIQDFKAVSGGTTIVGTFDRFLKEIEQHSAGVIDWVSFISHGNLNSIAFGGTIDLKKQDVMFSDSLGIGDLINTPLSERVKKLRDRFTKDALIDFYLCRAGANVGELKEIADAFQVKTRGFSAEIKYCPDFLDSGPKAHPQYKITDRKRVSVVSCQIAVKSSIFQLTPDRSANPKPDAP